MLFLRKAKEIEWNWVALSMRGLYSRSQAKHIQPYGTEHHATG